MDTAHLLRKVSTELSSVWTVMGFTHPTVMLSMLLEVGVDIFLTYVYNRHL